MAKKLIILASVVAALAALVAPAAATATPVLKSGGVQVPTSTALTGTANNSTLLLDIETELGTIECASYMLNGEVAKNNGTEIEVKGKTGSTTSGCSFDGELDVTVKDIANLRLFTNMVSGDTGTGTFEISFTAEVDPNLIVCKLGNVGKPGTFHYQLGTDTIFITKTNVTGTGCGDSSLEGEMTLETTNGSAITFS